MSVSLSSLFEETFGILAGAAHKSAGHGDLWIT